MFTIDEYLFNPSKYTKIYSPPPHSFCPICGGQLIIDISKKEAFCSGKSTSNITIAESHYKYFSETIIIIEEGGHKDLREVGNIENLILPGKDDIKYFDIMNYTHGDRNSYEIYIKFKNGSIKRMSKDTGNLDLDSIYEMINSFYKNKNIF